MTSIGTEDRVYSNKQKLDKVPNPLGIINLQVITESYCVGVLLALQYFIMLGKNKSS